MAKYKLEYIWLDGYEPVPNLRGKTQVKDFDSFPKLEQLPTWPSGRLDDDLLLIMVPSCVRVDLPPCSCAGTLGFVRHILGG